MIFIYLLLKWFHTRPNKNLITALHYSKQRRGKLINPLDPDSLRRAKFNSYEETTFIVHGFNGSHVDRHMRYLRDGNENSLCFYHVLLSNSCHLIAYLSRKFNVIMISWTRLTFYPCYLSALSNTKLVGQCAAQVYIYKCFSFVQSIDFFICYNRSMHF